MLVPLFFGVVGGLLGYVGVKSDGEGIVKSLLLFGIFITIVDFLIAWFSMLALLRLQYACMCLRFFISLGL